MNMNSQTASSPSLIRKEHLLPFILVTGLFVFWGIAVNLNSVLVKQFMKSFELSPFKAGLVTTAFFIGYFSLAIPAAYIMRRFNYKTGLVTGLILYALGSYMFWPAVLVGRYYMFLLALLIIASGLAFLETGANPFVAILGDPRTSEQRLNLSQSFNSFGAVGGVLIGTLFIFSGIELSNTQMETLKASGEYTAYLRTENLRVMRPYLVIGTVMLIWAFLLVRTRFPVSPDEVEARTTKQKASMRDLLKYPHFIKGVIAQFFYVGAQVGTWSYYIKYIEDYTGETEKLAGAFLTGTLVAFGAGRFAATYLMKHFKPNLLMGWFGLINIILAGLAVLVPGWLGVWTLFFTSFFMSLMFPTIFALGIKNLGHLTKSGGSLMVMSIVGGALLTPLMGLVFEIRQSMAMSMLIPLICYVVVTHYSFIGYKINSVP